MEIEFNPFGWRRRVTFEPRLVYALLIKSDVLMPRSQEAYDWLHDNLSGRFSEWVSYPYCIIEFYREEDAIAFELAFDCVRGSGW